MSIGVLFDEFYLNGNRAIPTPEYCKKFIAALDDFHEKTYCQISNGKNSCMYVVYNTRGADSVCYDEREKWRKEIAKGKAIKD